MDVKRSYMRNFKALPLTLCMPKKTAFLGLLGKKFPEKLSGLSVKGGGVPPLSAKEKNLLFFRLIFR